MRRELLLIPIAAVAAMPAPARAEGTTYLTLEQAQKIIFPGATFTPAFIPLSENMFQTIRETADVTQWTREIKAWKVSTGGWFIVDTVIGRDNSILYAIGLDANGTVTGMELMECLSAYDDVRNPAWRRLFIGARGGQYDPRRIPILSGATLSADHIRYGVKRVLVTYDLLLKQRG